MQQTIKRARDFRDRARVRSFVREACYATDSDYEQVLARIGTLLRHLRRNAVTDEANRARQTLCRLALLPAALKMCRDRPPWRQSSLLSVQGRYSRQAN